MAGSSVVFGTFLPEDPLVVEDPASKQAWRAAVLARRRSLRPERRAAEAAAITTALAALAGEEARLAAYLPVGSEPGSPELPEELVARGVTTLLPVVVGDELGWAAYGGAAELASGPLGTRHPRGPTCPSAELTEVTTMALPAMAVDRAGNRLGKGGGYYDRALPHVPDAVRLVAVVRDVEVVDHLPTEPHDVRVHAVVTPGRGLRMVPP
jgi:5-formyltetrahydrofolate cyclo-ligase